MVERTVNKSAVGTEKARATSWFMLPGGVLETTPAGIRPEVVRDEATLMTVSEEETCFALTVRSAHERDAPLDSHQLECAVGSNRAYASVANAMIAVREYGIDGSQSTLVGPTDAETYVTLDIPAVTPGTTRVIERSAEVCCPIRTFDWVELQITTPMLEPGQPAAFNSFGWRVQR